MPTFKQKERFKHAACIHAYMKTCIHAYIHTVHDAYIHAYTQNAIC